MGDYPPVVAALLELGKIDPRAEWIDYRARGLGREHVPELTRMLLDEELLETDVELAASWGPIHAFRALGQLQAAEAMDALLEARQRSHDRGGDWFSEAMPQLMGVMGPGALPALTANLRDSRLHLYPRWNSAECIAQIGERYPETREQCVAVLVEQLGRLENESCEEIETFRGGLIGCLMDLKAVEAAPLIERAYAIGVDAFLVGTWEDVRYELGLGPPPVRKPSSFQQATAPATRTGSPANRAKDRSRDKRKQAKQSKKKNRKKK